MAYFRFPWRLISAFCAVSVFVVFAGARAEERTACNFSVLGTFDTGAIVDARTFKLRDGREALLAGIEVPPDSVPAKAFLEKLLSDGKVLLRQTEPSADRYGRLLFGLSCSATASSIGFKRRCWPRASRR